MNKWMIVIAMILIALISVVVVYKDVLVELMFGFIDEPKLTTDQALWQSRITMFQGGTTADDRDFLIRKLLAFSAASTETNFARLAYKYYYEDFEKMTADNTLDATENSNLRSLYSDVLPEEDIEHWFRTRGRLVIGE
jgi:hypothetical protein